MSPAVKSSGGWATIHSLTWDGWNPVKARVYGSVGVHSSNLEGCFQLTHVPSGWRIASFDHQPDATSCAKEIAEIGGDPISSASPCDAAEALLAIGVHDIVEAHFGSIGKPVANCSRYERTLESVFDEPKERSCPT